MQSTVPYIPALVTRSLFEALGELQALTRQLIGTAPSFRRAIERLPDIARGEATVLITGETGTGKEMVARAIHYLSERAGQPFVAINCGAIPDSLLESELFGHEKGSFTDARSRQVGLIAQAGRGTVFLDEVDSLTPRAQVALLRVLQDQTIRAVGSTREERVDVRFIAASHLPLAQLVERHLFRADLFYRLCILLVTLPPLRERVEDIPLLANHLLRKHQSPDQVPLRFSSEALAALAAYPWPGNVRELENAVRRGMHLARGEVIESGDLLLGDWITAAGHSSPPTLAVPPTAAQAEPEMLPTFQMQKRLAIAAFEREYLARLLAEHQGNVSRAAAFAGKERRELGKLLKKHHLDPHHFQSRRTVENPLPKAGGESEGW